jgi:hypothetical protein
MAIDYDDLGQWIARNGPWLYHAAFEHDLPVILREGIRAGSELGRDNAPKPFHRTRPGHVYLCRLDHLERLQSGGDLPSAALRVDVRQLDPELIDPDEDCVQHARLFDGERWVSVEPPIWDPGWQEGPNGEGTLAYWAEHTPGFDAPDVTARSLERGRISYRGTVPPEALDTRPSN